MAAEVAAVPSAACVMQQQRAARLERSAGRVQPLRTLPSHRLGLGGLPPSLPRIAPPTPRTALGATLRLCGKSRLELLRSGSVAWYQLRQGTEILRRSRRSAQLHAGLPRNRWGGGSKYQGGGQESQLRSGLPRKQAAHTPNPESLQSLNLSHQTLDPEA